MNTFETTTTGGLGGEDPGMPAVPGLLERNLAALSRRDPRLAKRIASVSPSQSAVFEVASDELVTATLEGRRLASARRPGDEATRLSDTVDAEASAAVCVLGFGVGHHVRAIHERLGPQSLLVCFEPDVSLLRAVFERVDHAPWIAQGRSVILTDADDASEISRGISGSEGLLSLGLQIVEHPASRARLGDMGDRFGQALVSVVRSTRTQVLTTLVHAPVTLRNMLMNADRYGASAGIAPLKNACAGAPAVVVAAGPSLQKNLDLLGEPGVRDRVIIIAAQTVLKPMLKRGIRPHFVTALDHHELSARFYEGLTASDVEGVRLVVEPKANPSILESFPGEVLCTQEPILDQLLGEDRTRDMGELPNGGTVAHMSVYLARFLGCDPVVMIGQDLAFSDGQYYASGAAIHTVWQGELNANRSLEALEWERVARGRATLRKVMDQRGNSIYTDEQMATYLAQFEADFLKDTEKGLQVVDATEGGAVKRHTLRMTLREALDRFATETLSPLPDTACLTQDSGAVCDLLRARLDMVVRDAERIASQSNQTAGLLDQMLDAQHDQSRVGYLINEAQKIRDEVSNLQPAMRLVEFINQTGTLNRFRADRKIGLAGNDPVAKQRAQIERDQENVRWIADAARELSSRLLQTRRVIDGDLDKVTRDEPDPEPISVEARSTRTECFVLCDPDRSGLGFRRDLGEPVWRGRHALSLTLERALRCPGIDAVRLLTPDAERTRGLLEGDANENRVHIEPVDRHAWQDRTHSIGRARSEAGECWRGGVAQTTVHDEHLDPSILESVMSSHSVGVAAVVGADWTLIDPAVIRAQLDRHQEAPDRNAVVFTQAVPGLGAMVISRDAAAQLAEMQRSGSPLASVGGLLGYVPVAPQADPIASALCVKVDADARDAGVRAVADSKINTALIRGAMKRLGDHATESSLEQSARALIAERREHPATHPRSLILELCPGRLASGPFGVWKRGGRIPGERLPVSLRDAHRVIREHAEAREDSVLVLDGPGDPLLHPNLIELIQLADETGVSCVHLRTDLLRDGLDATTLAESGVGVVSVDLLATNAPTYAELTGLDRYEAVLERLGALIDSSGLGTPWVMPRMTKCERTLEQVEAFYDAWTMQLGGAAIDPVASWSNDPIEALAVPSPRARQLARQAVRVRCDGAMCNNRWRPIGDANAFSQGLDQAVRSARRARLAAEVAA